MDKIVYLPQGTGTALDGLNKTLEEGWEIVQMRTASCSEDSCRFV